MDELNNFTAQHGGAIALAGLSLAVVGIIVAVYFYYNPRRPSYKVVYRKYSPHSFYGWVYEKVKQFTTGDELEKFTHRYYVDLWNAGKETILDDVIRQDLAIGLQESVAKRGISLLAAVIDKETHPGVSAFTVNLQGSSAVLGWSHFDPGMGVRIRLELTQPVRDDEITVFGGGLRLSLWRARFSGDLGELGTAVHRATVLVLPFAAFVLALGLALRFVSHLQFTGYMPYLMAVPFLIAIIAMIAIAVFTAIVLQVLFESIFNTKSPLVAEFGSPSADEEIPDEFVRLYLERLNSRELWRLFQRLEMEGIGISIRSDAPPSGDTSPPGTSDGLPTEPASNPTA